MKGPGDLSAQESIPFATLPIPSIQLTDSSKTSRLQKTNQLQRKTSGTLFALD
jgi:hypothetical protein